MLRPPGSEGPVVLGFLDYLVAERQPLLEDFRAVLVDDRDQPVIDAKVFLAFILYAQHKPVLVIYGVGVHFVYGLLAREDWEKRTGEWLPTDEDRAYVATLQKPVREPGQIANWIARPARGIKGLPFEYEYVRLD